jgi:uncharacterized protein YcbX
MVVDEDGGFLSQRSKPEMCLFHPSIAGGALRIRSGDCEIELPLQPEGERVQVQVWRDVCEAVRVSDEADAWLTKHLGIPARLVYMPEDVVRQTNLDFTLPGDKVGFADAFPLLVASHASLEDLNRRLAEPIPMNRFRPNLVLSGTDPFEEDSWPAFELGGIRFRAAKKCGRCQVTTTNQDTAEVGQEPLRTLATFRRDGNTVLFGAYFVPESGGVVRVGDDLKPFS